MNARRRIKPTGKLDLHPYLPTLRLVSLRAPWDGAAVGVWPQRMVFLG